MKLINLVPLTEEESSGRITKVKIDILGDEKEVIIDKKGEGLSEPVTISWDEPWGREKHNVEFELDEKGEGITNQSQAYDEPSEAIFKGVSDLWEFYVEVELDANYEESDNIWNIFWEKDRWHNGLEITKDPRMDPAIRSDFDDPIIERMKKIAGIRNK